MNFDNNISMRISGENVVYQWIANGHQTQRTLPSVSQL